MHQAIQLTKESIQTENTVSSQIDSDNLKVNNLKFEAPEHVILLRPLVHLGEDQICVALGQRFAPDSVVN